MTTNENIASLDTAEYPLIPCIYCGQPTTETYSYSRATMDPEGNGYSRIHVQHLRVGDKAPLGPVECQAGQSGWGA